MKRFLVSGKAILICHVDDSFYAVTDMCTHEDASLYLGCLKGKEVECSLHGGRFNVITGQATAEPAEEPINTWPVKIENERLFIQI